MKYVQSKKAHLTYALGKSMEAGIELTGQEVKSIKRNDGSLDGARVIVRGGEAFIIGLTIPPYQPSNTKKSYDPGRVRKLLLSKKEIQELYNETENKHLTILPLSLYSKGLLVKCEIALGKRKSKEDKRETLKQEESDRTLRNAKLAWYDYE